MAACICRCFKNRSTAILAVCFYFTIRFFLIKLTLNPVNELAGRLFS